MVKKFLFSVLVAALVYAFFFGPLLPFSPLKIGYEKLESNKAVVYIKDSNKLAPFYKNIDQTLLDIESFTGLQYKNKVQILVALDPNELKMYIPWLQYQGLNSVSLPMGNMIYINTPTIDARNYYEEEFVKHELVQALISQNTNLYSNYLLTKQHWFSEGLASYYGGPYYYTANEFKNLLLKKKLIKSDQPNDIYSNLDPQDPKFNDSLYRFFIEFMVQTYGREKFQSFLQRYVRKPEDYMKLYFEEFNTQIGNDLELFEEQYREEIIP